MTQRSLPVFLLVAGVCAGFSPPLRAQQAPPVDATAVLATLKDLRTKQAGIITKEKSGVLAAITAAMSDPGKAYAQAQEAADPQATGPNAGSHIVEIRKKLADQLRDHDFVNGLRLQLAYLNLTWQRSMGVKTRQLVPALLDYAGQVNGNYGGLSHLDMFQKSLQESVFTTYFQVGPYISGLMEWSDRPFDVESIYQKTILPEMRRDKDPRLLDYWDGKLQSEAAHATASGNGLNITKFNHVRRPSLLWSRAEDELALGNSDQAVADMLGLLKANPDHPDFEKWATELEGIVSAKSAPPTGEVTVGPATLVTPTPGLLPAAPIPGAR